MSSNCHGNRRRVELLIAGEGGRLYVFLCGHKKCPKDFEPFQTRPGVNLRNSLTLRISEELCEQTKKTVNNS